MDTTSTKEVRLPSGIYAIVCTVTGGMYIGQSRNLQERWKIHRTSLRGGRGVNQFLQAAWDEHGESAFEFRVLVRCDPDKLDRYEASCIRRFRPAYNVNIPERASRIRLPQPEPVKRCETCGEQIEIKERFCSTCRRELLKKMRSDGYLQQVSRTSYGTPLAQAHGDDEDANGSCGNAVRAIES